jgi:hypothetical protein
MKLTKLIIVIAIIFATGCDKGNKDILGDNDINTTIKDVNENVSVLDMEPPFTIVDIQTIVGELNSKTKAPTGWWDKIKKWIKKHTGSHILLTCNGSYPCGPCAGMCLSGSVFNGEEIKDDFVSKADYLDGLRAFGMFLIENKDTKEELIMFVFKRYVDDFVIDNFFYMEKDIYAEKKINKMMVKRKILFLKGKYNVVFDKETNYYYTIVKTKIN